MRRGDKILHKIFDRTRLVSIDDWGLKWFSPLPGVSREVDSLASQAMRTDLPFDDYATKEFAGLYDALSEPTRTVYQEAVDKPRAHAMLIMHRSDRLCARAAGRLWSFYNDFDHDVVYPVLGELKLKEKEWLNA